MCTILLTGRYCAVYCPLCGDCAPPPPSAQDHEPAQQQTDPCHCLSPEQGRTGAGVHHHAVGRHLPAGAQRDDRQRPDVLRRPALRRSRAVRRGGLGAGAAGADLHRTEGRHADRGVDHARLRPADHGPANHQQQPVGVHHRAVRAVRAAAAMAGAGPAPRPDAQHRYRPGVHRPDAAGRPGGWQPALQRRRAGNPGQRRGHCRRNHPDQPLRGPGRCAPGHRGAAGDRLAARVPDDRADPGAHTRLLLAATGQCRGAGRHERGDPGGNELGAEVGLAHPRYPHLCRRTGMGRDRRAHRR
ncbi:hypothetical protein D3C71_1440170 [compost metagenome]